MAIFLITGVPGAGKTCYALNFVKTWADREKRPVFYHNIKELTLPWSPLERGEDWFKVEPTSIVVIDEAQKVFRPRGTGSVVPEHVTAFETHRHLGIDVVLITQHPMLVDTNIRRLIERHFHCKRKFGMQRCVVHEFTELRQNPDTSREGSIRHEFKYPKESFGWYKSAEVHTHKRRLPARYVMLFVAPFVLAGLIFATVKWFSGSIYGTGDKIKKAGGVDVSGQSATGVIKPAPGSPSTGQALGGRGRLDDNEWLSQQRARIVGLPHTAPIYDGLSQVAVMPIPAACVASSDKCECYTEQGTRLPAVQEVICRDIVRNGWFDPYQKGRNLQGPSDKSNARSSTSTS